MAKGGEFILINDELRNAFQDVFTTDNLSEDHLMIGDSVRELVSDTVATSEASARIETKDLGYSRELINKFAQLGVLGIEVPEEYGGVDLGTIVSTIVAEQMSAQGSFATTVMAHSGIGTLPILFFGNEEQKKKYLPKLVSGEWVGAYSLTEPDAGSDANNIKATAVKSEDGKNYILNGKKSFVTNGGFADVFIVFAKIDGKDLSAFIVERTFSGIEVGKEEHKMGIQGSSTTPLFLDNCLVPVENLLGEQGKGFKIAVNILNLGRFKLGAACLGAGKRCFFESLRYAKDRKQFGQPIINFGAIRGKIAQMAARNFAMESIVYRTAGLLEGAIHGVGTKNSKAILKAIEEYSIECSLVKVYCSEALGYIVDENVQVHGGSGFCEGNPERHYRDARINRIFEGTNEINRLLSVGMLLKKAATGSLPLMGAIKKVVSESMTPAMSVEPEALEDKLFYYLNNAKKVVLLASGSAYEKFGLGLEKHQTLLMALSDCLINIYVMESVLAVLSKKANEGHSLLARLIFNDSMLDIERLSREVIAMCSEGDSQRTQMAMIRRLLKFTLENKEDLYDKIVAGY